MAARQILTAALLLVVTLASACSDDGPERERVVIDGRTFELDYAVDDETRQRGLGGRAEISEDGGMIFVFPDPEFQAFWMYDCLVDIDIIYLDARGTITAVHRMKAEPQRGPDDSDRDYEARLPRYPSVYPAQFAIELRSGWLDRLDLSVDDRIELDLDRLKAMAR